MSTCVFCFRAEGDLAPFCPENPGKGCTYGLAHEYPGAGVAPALPVPKRRDAKLCVLCGLHPRNPASATNGCAHSYARQGDAP